MHCYFPGQVLGGSSIADCVYDQATDGRPIICYTTLGNADLEALNFCDHHVEGPYPQ